MAELETTHAEAAQLIAGRYRIDSMLGRGGMGSVYAVTDLASGMPLALKRPHRGSGRAAHAHEQLRSEYELLVDLSHPSIVRVHDYGFDELGPYYTMELLSGSNLSDHHELGWQQACALICDVASSLAVLHARGLVHRDVSLRNIHYDAAQQRCKLLDFGAITHVGAASAIVGTPPYLPPEALDGLPLSARSDLFSLGACVYRLLTGVHAYPAARIEELRASWQHSPKPPHALDPSIPEALSQLTLALLALDPVARPNSAAEVMDRLNALAGRPEHEPASVHRAYLSAPALVGRGKALQQLRDFVAREHHDTAWLVIGGPSGVGRSRMLKACVVQGRLAGLHVVQVSAKHPLDPYTVVNAIAAELLKTVPEAREHPLTAAALSRLRAAIQHERSGVSEPGSEHPEHARTELQQALGRWLGALAELRPLLIAIDDAERIDEATAGFLVALCEASEPRAIRVALALASDRTPQASEALQWLQRSGKHIALENLTKGQVLELLASVFGDAPNVRLLAERMFGITGGHPQWTLQLAHHLVEQRAVRYEAGAFLVPDQLSLARLPTTLQAALSERLAALSPLAQDVVHAFMLEPELWFRYEELARLCALPDSAIANAGSELIAAGIVSDDGTQIGLSLHAFGSALQQQADATTRKRWHARLAGMFEHRGDVPRAAQQLWAAGEEAAAVALLVPWSEALATAMAADGTVLDRAVANMPARFLDTLVLAVDACIALGRAKRDEMILRCACVDVGATTLDGVAIPQLKALLVHLRRDAGLDAYERLSSIADPVARLTQALAETDQQHQTESLQTRGFPASEAIPVLAVMLGHATALFPGARDYELAACLPSLAPLMPLSPALWVVEELVQAGRALLTSQIEDAIASYREILVQLQGEAGTAMQATQRRYIELGVGYTIAIIVAMRGQPEALRWADQLDSELLFEVAAWRVRWVYHQACGELEQAERCRRQSVLLRIQRKPHRHLEGSQISSELSFCIIREDLLETKRVIELLQPTAERFAGWLPAVAVTKAEYCRMRGEHHAALAYCDEALPLCPVHDGMWALICYVKITTLIALGRVQEACALGRTWALQAREAKLHDNAMGLFARLAIAEAALGHSQRALALLDEIERDAQAVAIGGMRLAICNEASARVWMLLGDVEGFTRAAGRYAALLRTGDDPAMWARYERMLRDARSYGMPTETLASERTEGDRGDLPALDWPAIERRLRGCAGAQQRAEILLELLVVHSRASFGQLYVAWEGATQLRASFGELPLSPSGLARKLQTQLAPDPRAGGSDAMHEATCEASVAASVSDARSFLLTEDSGGESLLVGIALLERGHERAVTPSRELLRLVTRALIDAGDAQPMPLA